MSSLPDPTHGQQFEPGAPAEVSASFIAALAAVTEARMAGPELLPARLARAVAAVLSVDGAGISVLSGDLRVPLGASSDLAATAERLQFTHGAGPCLDAAHRHRLMVADRNELHRHWPLFAEELFDRTPYRAILTVPLHIARDTWGATDLYLADDSQLPDISLAAAAIVADEIVRALHFSVPDPAATPPLFSEPGQAWLNGPAAQNRRIVWVAIGMTMAQQDLNSPDALAVLRSYAYSHDRMLDDLCADLAFGRMPIEDLEAR